MLRPSTPLTVVFLIAFALLLVSSLSTPIIKGISLADFDGSHFGVWGFCRDNDECSRIEVGYTVEEIAPFRVLHPHSTSNRGPFCSHMFPLGTLLTLPGAIAFCSVSNGHVLNDYSYPSRFTARIPY